MLIRLGYSITWGLPQPTPMVLVLDLHESRRTDVLIEAHHSLPVVPLRRYRDSFGNLCTRLVAPPGTLTVQADAVIQDDGLPDLVVPDAPEEPIDALPAEVLQFLLGSRYCETDQLMTMAWDLFGAVPPGWQRVQAICNYVHASIRFGYAYADSTRTAARALEQGHGVCRDFAHTAVALCRCMNLPARYCTGYLGDIRIPATDGPMDFSAWFEVWLGGRWYTFDSRHNTPRIGRVLIARGRDAADVAISTTFGPNQLLSFNVWSDETTDPTLSPRGTPELALAG